MVHGMSEYQLRTEAKMYDGGNNGGLFGEFESDYKDALADPSDQGVLAANGKAWGKPSWAGSDFKGGDDGPDTKPIVSEHYWNPTSYTFDELDLDKSFTTDPADVSAVGDPEMALSFIAKGDIDHKHKLIKVYKRELGILEKRVNPPADVTMRLEDVRKEIACREIEIRWNTIRVKVLQEAISAPNQQASQGKYNVQIGEAKGTVIGDNATVTGGITFKATRDQIKVRR